MRRTHGVRRQASGQQALNLLAHDDVLRMVSLDVDRVGGTVDADELDDYMVPLPYDGCRR